VNEKIEELKEKMEAFKEVMDPITEGVDAAKAVALGKAVFKAKVGKQYRITVPEAERESLGIEKGDIVQVTLKKVEG